VPRSRVLKDDVMIEIAQSAPKNAEALANLRSFPKGMERSRAGAEILAAVERGLSRDPAGMPRIERERRGSNGATVELLKVLLRQVAEQTGVAAKMIATVEDLEAIAGDDRADVPALRGWRRTIFGEKALELKRGRLALAVENGKVVTFDWQEAEAENARPPVSGNGVDATAEVAGSE
jgi:ribonuclease D